MIWSSTETTISNKPHKPFSADRHMLACGGSHVCKKDPVSADNDEKHEVRCCSDTRKGTWVKNSQCSVWGESDLPRCIHAATYQEAEAHCANNGARLCTQYELQNDCTRGSGCSHDYDMIWSSTNAFIDMRSKGERNCGKRHQKPCTTQWLPNDGCDVHSVIAKPFNSKSCWPCGGNNQIACKFKWMNNQGCREGEMSRGGISKGGDASRPNSLGVHHGYNEKNPNPHPAGKCWRCGNHGEPACDHKYGVNNGCKDGMAQGHANKCWRCGADNQPKCNVAAGWYANNNGCKSGHSGTHHGDKCWSCNRSNVQC
jgi:hypothetical protein